MKVKLAQKIIGCSILIFVTTSIAFSQGKIAFNSCADGNCEIYLINPDGSGDVRLTFNAAQDTHPSLSANGTKIAFVSDRDGNSEIYKMNLDGSSLTRLTNNIHGDTQPAFNSRSIR